MPGRVKLVGYILLWGEREKDCYMEMRELRSPSGVGMEDGH